MKPPAAPLTHAIPAALASASMGLSLFVLRGGGGSLRPLPAVPGVDLLVGRVAASLEPRVRAPIASAPRPLVARPAAGGASSGTRPEAVSPAPGRRSTPAVQQHAVVVVPHPAPAANTAALPAPHPQEPPRATRWHGKGKAHAKVEARVPLGIPQQRPKGRAEGHDHSRGSSIVPKNSANLGDH